MEEFDIIVIGGGSGLTLAHLADQAGKKIAIIDEGGLGGTCVRDLWVTHEYRQSGQAETT